MMTVKVAIATGRTVDPDRLAWGGEKARPLAWTAWYPTDDGAEEDIVLGPGGAPWMWMGRAVPNGRLAAAPAGLPVVLLSHGTGGAARGVGWLACRLAAAGHVVLGVDHHGNTHAEPPRPEGYACWWERARDLTVLLDRMLVESRFAGRLDTRRVFAAGYSLGGHTALALAGAITDMRQFRAWLAGRPDARSGPPAFPDLGERIERLLAVDPVIRQSWARQSDDYGDHRVRAVLACAPAPPVRGFVPASLARINVPVAIAAAGDDAEAPIEDCARWLHAALPRSDLVEVGAEAGHAVFLCEGTALGRRLDPDACLDPPSVDRRAVHDRVAAAALSLFGSAA